MGCEMNPFETPAPKYATVRPAYPAQALDIMVERVGGSAHSPQRAADVGAGTGKMSVLLAERGFDVDAIEPAAPMRQALTQLIAAREGGKGTGSICVYEATGEATGRSDAAYDLVVYAQSWHWVDEPAASVEAARILKTEGILAAVWNQMDVSQPWVHRLTRIMRSGDVHRPENPPKFGGCFEAPTLNTAQWIDVMTPEEILDLGTTRASYLRQDEAGRARMQANLRWYLYEHLGYEPGEDVEVPYTTLVWTAALKKGAGSSKRG